MVVAAVVGEVVPAEEAMQTEPPPAPTEGIVEVANPIEEDGEDTTPNHLVMVVPLDIEKMEASAVVTTFVAVTEEAEEDVADAEGAEGEEVAQVVLDETKSSRESAITTKKNELDVTNIVYRPDEVSAVPDARIAQMEDDVVAREQRNAASDLASQMSQLQIQKGSKGTKNAAQEPEVDAQAAVFPARPAFGTKGRPVVVWANYFQIRMANRTEPLYRYTVSVTESVTSKTGEPVVQEAVGMKRQLAIAAVIKSLGPQSVIATEFKSQLLSAHLLDPQPDRLPVKLESVSEDRNSDTVYVTFSEPTPVSFGQLMHHLTSMEVDADDKVFPRCPEAIDALNIILGHGPRSMFQDISVVGNNRVFPFDSRTAVAKFQSSVRPLLAARGLFQSVRIGTGRLLLNTNVTHGVFKVDGKVDELFRKFNIRPVGKGDRRGIKSLKAFSKFLPRTKAHIVCMISNGKMVRMTKPLSGLVSVSELRDQAREKHGLRFADGMEYCGPKHVKFLLTGPDGTGEYVSITDYYASSKFQCPFKSLPQYTDTVYRIWD